MTIPLMTQNLFILVKYNSKIKSFFIQSNYIDSIVEKQANNF